MNLSASGSHLDEAIVQARADLVHALSEAAPTPPSDVAPGGVVIHILPAPDGIRTIHFDKSTAQSRYPGPSPEGLGKRCSRDEDPITGTTTTADTWGGFMHVTSAVDILRLARQCASLIDVLRAEIEQGIGAREAELIGLADDLASRLYAAFWETPGGGERSFSGEAVLKLSGIAGRLRAATYAMHEMAARGGKSVDVLHDDFSGILGWMQCVADDLASEIVLGIEQAIEDDRPPPPRVEVGGRDSGPAESHVARQAASSMDRHGSSLAAP